MAPTFAEFFAGIGLVRLGLEQAGWRCAFANDIDPKKREMYEAHFSDADSHFLLDDIRRIESWQLPQVDLATASFPCTDLSLAGSRAGLAGDQSSALWPFLELMEKVKTMRPSLIMLENVVGFLSSHGGADFKSALLAINRLGYSVDAFIVDAAHFVPQSRPRLFVVAERTDIIGVAERRQSLHLYESQARPAALADFILRNPDIDWNLQEIPCFPTRNTTLSDIVETLPPSAKEWWNTERTEYLLDQMSDRHRGSAEKMKSADQIQYGTVFRRVRNGRSMAELRTDGTAGCLRTPKGGSGRQILLEAGFGQLRVRLLTPRECARLMGADHYRLTVPVNQALFGFGDAVCVHVIKWIADNILTPKIQNKRVEFVS